MLHRVDAALQVQIFGCTLIFKLPQVQREGKQEIFLGGTVTLSVII